MDSWHVQWTLYHWDILLWSIHVEKYTDVSFLMKSWSWIYKFINNRLVLAISLLGEAETLPWRFFTSPYRSAECLGTKVRREELYLLDQNTKPRNVFEGRTLVISKGHSLTGKVGGGHIKSVDWYWQGWRTIHMSQSLSDASSMWPFWKELESTCSQGNTLPFTSQSSKCHSYNTVGTQ